MTAEPTMQPGADAPRPPEPTAPTTPDREISLEEWIAAGQACCGAGRDE